MNCVCKHPTNKALGVTNIKKQKNKGNKEKIDECLEEIPPRTQEPNDMNRDEIEKAIELAATTH